MSFVPSFDQLKRLIAQEKEKGKTIVTTNGCFDVIHVGHTRYLAQAKTLGDVLAVGINSDSSVRKIKGNNRPVNSEQDRAEIVAALRWVDYTFVFDEADPIAFLRELKPNVHAKGGDYTLDKIIEREAVESNGGVIKVLSKVEGHSTTDLLQKIRMQ